MDTIGSYETYLGQHPSGEYSSEAKSRLIALRESAAWRVARGANSDDAYKAYSSVHPNGDHAEEAQIRQRILKLDKVQAELRIEAPEGYFMQSDPFGSVQQVPPGTTMKLELNTMLNGEPVTGAFTAKFSELIDGVMYFHGDNGECFWSGSRDPGFGLCENVTFPLPANDDIAGILLFAWVDGLPKQ